MSKRMIFNDKQVAYLNLVQQHGEHTMIQNLSDQRTLTKHTTELTARKASGKKPKRLDRRRTL